MDKPVTDSLKNANKLLKTSLDSLISVPDSLKSDSIIVSKVMEDTLKLPMDVGDLTEAITYEAKDSIIYDLENEMIHLYNGTQVKYEETEISAPETHFNYVEKTVTSNALDNEKATKEKVVLLQDGKEYKGDKMVYNFETQKGKINDLLTSDDGEGFIHGDEVKMNEQGELFAQDAYYTTCEADHPHFHINVDKVKIIPDKLIVSGLANLVIADVPTPLVLPFGIFPLNKDRASGIILPSYGQSPGLGFYLQQGGYYWAVNDYMDLALLGDIYTNGSWRASIASQYKMRYRYSGNLNFSIGRIFQNDRISPDFTKDNEYRISWSHRQDPKARPNSTFSSSVNFTSSNYQRSYNTQSQRDLDNVVSSSISYNYNLPRSPFSLSVSARHSQNLNTNSFSLTLPNANLNMSPIYPFEKKVRVGSKKWYENTKISYSGSFNNRLNTLDSLIFEKETYQDFQTDVSHSIPINTQFKLFKHFTLSPSIRYTEKWFFKYLEYDRAYLLEESETINDIEPIERRGFRQSREFSNIGPSINTNLYGIFNFKRGKIKAIRHVMSPSLSYNFLPDFSAPFWNNYQEVQISDESGVVDTVRFSRFINSSTSSQKQSSLSVSLGNRFDMKVRTPKDSINKEKKIELLRNLNFNSSYNFAAESFKMANISMRANANFLNRFNVIFNSSFSPYVFDTIENRIMDAYLIQQTGNRQLARFRDATLTLNTSFSSGDVEEYFSNKGNESDIREINEHPDRFLDFNRQWNVRLGYNFGLRKILDYSEDNEIDSIAINRNNLNVTFDLNLTDKWKISGGTGYDFVQKELTYTNLNISRDLHCWQMNFNVVPFGDLKSYNFRINVKAAVLQDLKLTRVRSWYDF